MRIILTVLALALAVLAAAENPALMPHEQFNNWGKWGDAYEKGATNYITPEAIVKAAKLIKKGKTFSLAVPIDGAGPLFPTRRPPFHLMSATGTDAFAAKDPNSDIIAFTDDYIIMPLQGSSQWDGLPHAYYGGYFFNGVPLTAVTNQGASMLGIENVKDAFVGRGVLIDMVRYKGGALEKGYGIMREDIEGALKAQKTKIEEGDIVIIRTGEVPAFYEGSAEEKRAWMARQTGITKSVVPWIHENKIAAIAADNIGVEQAPNSDGHDWNLHGNILRDMGVFIGEVWWLEDLAADCAEDGRYEFFISAPPLNIPGAVGSPVNPIVVK